FWQRCLGNPKPARVQDGRRDFSQIDFRNYRRPDGRDIIHAKHVNRGSANDPGMLAIESSQDIGEQRCQVRRENANQLAFWSRGIQERTEQIKNCALMSSGQLLPHFRQRSKRRVIGSRENKSAAEPFDTLAQIIRLEIRSEEHTSELQSLRHLVCRLLLEKKKNKTQTNKQ